MNSCVNGICLSIVYHVKPRRNKFFRTFKTMTICLNVCRKTSRKRVHLYGVRGPREKKDNLEYLT